MNELVNIIRKIYREILPPTIRDSHAVNRLKRYLFILLPHDTIYNSEYYQNIENSVVASAGAIVDSIISNFEPKTIIDVGCGTGALLEELRARGCEVAGLEYSEAALNYCRVRKLDVRKFDLALDVFEDDEDSEGKTTFDVAVSMEVAEHLPKKSADRYVQLLTNLSGTVVFTAAPPGQGGTDHINEQPPSYWISMFMNFGFEHDEKLSKSWSSTWKSEGVISWYYDNLMIFNKRDIRKTTKN